MLRNGAVVGDRGINELSRTPGPPGDPAARGVDMIEMLGVPETTETPKGLAFVAIGAVFS